MKKLLNASIQKAQWLGRRLVLGLAYLSQWGQSVKPVVRSKLEHLRNWLARLRQK